MYMDRTNLPGEDEQLAVYRHVLERMAPRPVVIRTLDIGADKQAGYFQLDKEENPALGFRAVPICPAVPLGKSRPLAGPSWVFPSRVIRAASFF